MKKLYEIKEKLIDEIETYADKSVSPSTVEAVDKLAHAAKNIGKIIEMCEGEGEQSERDGSYRGGSYRRGRGMYRDGSYRRGSYDDGIYPEKRDSLGRYSRAADDVAEKLHHMIDEAPDEKTRHELHRMLDKLEQL